MPRNVDLTNDFAQLKQVPDAIVESNDGVIRVSLGWLLFGAVDPNGSVTGDPGDLYIRRDGVASNLYVNISAAPGGTDWSALS